MKSSDFERLGDWQRKQRWGYDDALSDKMSRNDRTQQRSSVISTDISTLSRKTSIKSSEIKHELPELLMINCVLNARNHKERINVEEKDYVFFCNGKSTIKIKTNILEPYFTNYYAFDEYFENENVKSTGCFRSETSGIPEGINTEYYRRENYKGSEYFRQTFIYDGRLATISFVIKKVGRGTGWGSCYSKYSMSLIVSYYDVSDSIYLKHLTLEALLRPDGYLITDEIPKHTDIIPIVSEKFGDIAESCDNRFYKNSANQYQESIQNGLIIAYKKVERFLETKLERKEKLSFVKKLIPPRNVGNKGGKYE